MHYKAQQPFDESKAIHCAYGIYIKLRCVGDNSWSKPRFMADCASTKAKVSDANAAGWSLYIFLENWSNTMISAKLPRAESRHWYNSQRVACVCSSRNRSFKRASNASIFVNQLDWLISSNQNLMILNYIIRLSNVIFLLNYYQLNRHDLSCILSDFSV